jgi:hypothetical protein
MTFNFLICGARLAKRDSCSRYDELTTTSTSPPLRFRKWSNRESEFGLPSPVVVYDAQACLHEGLQQEEEYTQRRERS